MSGIVEWFNRVLGRSPRGVADGERTPMTEAGRFTVVLESIGKERHGVVDALQVITPLDRAQIDEALASLPMTVRIGLTHSAARSVRDRLQALGARAQIEEFGD